MGRYRELCPFFRARADLEKPPSYSKLALSFKAESTSYDPGLHDKLAAQFEQDFPGLFLHQLQSQDLSDDLTFSLDLLRSRLQYEGVISAYSNNGISLAASSGLNDVTLRERPGARSPAHKAYCSSIAVVSAVVSALRRHHFFDAEACEFVQLYGKQIVRALSWSVSDPITLPLLDEIEQVVNLFYALAESAPPTAYPNPVVVKVLRVSTTYALTLLQQLNYALMHPNHIASLLEPVTAE
ncbi:hypothetical protein AZE42_03056 [Rhizopogon vesiculosus]|uniref:Uncharacterized protein n=1 Tax=Rhizopogon vesiculosus TaxID=180088 RepID=A0A1J8QBF0_9AGAM|nr:hypothetical protein AZE42_03056 [Rhizopogon vesiculosus]